MLPDLLNSPLSFLFTFLALITGITIHEFAHAYAAERLGDPTPRLMGRLTLNPLSHLDPIGTILILLVGFGWGKPVQFDPFNLRNPKRDGAIISLAGPLSNLILAGICSLIFQIILSFFPIFDAPMQNFPTVIMLFLRSVIILNVVLSVFNLVPVHPLDGFKIVEGILPDQYARQWQELKQYGFLILIALMFPIFSRTSPIDAFISPIISFIIQLLLPEGRIA